ncbi:MAG: zinc-ribbon domain-containing protein [Ruminiclostridium sp.]
MFCRNCGNPLPEGARFCGSCGTPVAAAPVEEKAVEAVEAPVAVEEKAAEFDEKAAEFDEKAAEFDEKAAEFDEKAAAFEEKAVETAEAPVAVEQTQPEVPAMPESNTVICRNCGNQLPEKAIFCGSCGTPVAAAPVEEKAVEAVEAPAAVEEKAAEAAEKPAATEQQPANAAVTANSAMPAGVAMPENGAEPALNAPKKKKKIRKAPIIAAAAAVVVAAGAAVGYFCFHDKITRLFMGDVGYAKMIDAGSYTDYMLPELGTDKDSADKTTVQYINNALAAAQAAIQIEDNSAADNSPAEDSENELSSQDIMLINIMEQLKSLIYKSVGGKDAGFSAEYHVDISVGPQIKLLLGTYADKVLNAIGELGLRYTVVAGDTSKIGLDVIDGQGDLGGIELYFNSSDLCIAAPDITDSVIAFELPEAETKKNEMPTLGEEDIKRIASGIGGIYFSYFDKAEITYTDNAVTAAGKTGTAVSVKLSGAVLKEMAAEVLDFIKNDSYVKAYLLSAGITETKYNEVFDKAAAELAAKEIEGYAEIINYVDVHNNVLGKTIVMYDDSTKSKAEMAVSSAENRTLIDFTEEKEGKSEGKFSIINEKSGETSGTLYFKMPIEDEKSGNSGEKLLSIAVDYESTGETTFLGNKVPLGKVTIRFADDDTLIDSLAGSGSSQASENQQEETSAKLMESIGASGSSLVEMLLSGQLKKSKLEISIENGESGPVSKTSITIGDLASFAVETSYIEIHEQQVMPSLDKAIDVKNSSKKEQTLLQLDFMKWAKKLSERNDFWGELLPSAEIDESIEQTEKSLKFYDHYSEYTDYLAYSADRDAEKLDEAFNNGISDGTISFDDVPTDVELYFDSEGNVVVIESGSWYGDFPAVFSDCKLKSAYVRIGVTTFETHTIVVYTDKSTDLPANLPDKFNFMDGVYEWEEDNVIGEFVVGTYPALEKGESTAADEYAALDKSVERLEKYAEAIGKTAQNAEKMSPALINAESNKDTEVSLEIEADGNGSWSVVSAREERWEEKVEDYFNQEYLDRLISLLGSTYNTKSVKDCHAEIIFENGVLVGVNVYDVKDGLSFEDYGLPQGSDYVAGYYFMWSGRNGIWDEPQHGYYISANGILKPLGTYCIETGKPLGTYNEYVAAGAGFDFGAVEGAWELCSINGVDLEQSEYADYRITLIVSANSVIMTNGEEAHEAVPMATDSNTFVCEFDDNFGGTISFTFRYIEERDIIICYPDDDDINSIEFKRGQLPPGYFDSTGFDFGVVEGSWRISAVGDMDTGDVIDIGPNDGVDISLSISANNVVFANEDESYSGVPVMAEEGSVFTCVFTDEDGVTEILILSYAADEDKIYCYSDLEDESGYFIFSRVQ